MTCAAPICRRARRAALPFALFALVFLGTLHLASTAPLTWDEGDAFNRAVRVEEWFRALVVGPERTRRDDPREVDGERRELRLYFSTMPSRVALFSPETLEIGFQHLIYREGHPSGASLAIAFGDFATRALPWSISEKTRFRSGCVFLFSAALTVVFWRVRRDYGTAIALAGTACVLFSPRVLGHAIIAGGDSLLISSWLAAWALFDSARGAGTRAILWGAAVAVSFCAKSSGFLLVLPFALVAVAGLATRRLAGREAARLVFGLVVALALFLLANPPGWRDPFAAASTFWRLNTERAEFNIPIYFFGELYSPTRPLPFWNGFFWLIAATPALLSVLAILAIFSRRGASAPLTGTPTAFLLAITIPLARILPGIPVHDGARLLIASVALWSLLGGLGAGRVALWAASRVSSERARRRRVVAATCLALCVAPSAADALGSRPQFLSFYSAFVGGVEGATRMGLEPTYYWDGFDAQVASRLHELSAEARAQGRPDGILFGSFSTQTLDYYARWGVFGAARVATVSNPAATQNVEQYGFYVLQRRPSGYVPFDLTLLKEGKLLLRKNARNPMPLPFAERGKTPILDVYEFPRVP
ncbi:MAG: hypothetical protein ACI4NP_00510 [Thermoguttaceae bacterium]